MFELYDYQQELVDKAQKHFKNGSKGVLIQSPPGSGKSIVIAEIAKRSKGNVLFIVHRKELIEQIKETFEKHGVPKEKLTVETVIKTSNRLGEFPEPNLIITDESHHSRAKTYRKIYDFYDEAFRLGFTATPWRMNGVGFTDIYDSLVLGKSVNWLIENNRLADFEYYQETIIDSKKLKASSRNNDFTSQSMDDAIEEINVGDIVKNYREKIKGKKTIVYCHRVAVSEQVAEIFNDAGIPAEHANGKTPKAERENIMERFRKGEIKVLTNVDLVSEGFDVPDCSAVILLRPTKSLVLHLQQSMRCMRYQPDKKAVIIDHVGNNERLGIPDDEFDWKKHFVGTEKKKKKSNNEEGDLQVTTCPHCCAVIKFGTRVCPICKNEIKEDKNYKLNMFDSKTKLIRGGLKTDYTLVNHGKKDIEDLETFEDFFLFAVARDYKLTWIKHQKLQYKKMEWWEFWDEVTRVKNLHPQYKNY